MRHFDMQGFHHYLDEERRKRGLGWVELAEEVNRPFINTPSIPIHPATLRDMPKKRSVTSAVVLQVLRWLDNSPEAFLVPSFPGSLEETALPRTKMNQVLRLDTQALHAELNAERQRRGMTWAQVAKELPGFQVGMLTNLASGPLIGFPRVMLLTQWLDLPLARFVRARSR
jgi:hypothetical protein